MSNKKFRNKPNSNNTFTIKLNRKQRKEIHKTEQQKQNLEYAEREANKLLGLLPLDSDS